MYIGKVAERTGATRRAIRLYESLGLIPAPQRRGNYRVYSETEIKAIALIKRTQDAGFSLGELTDFIQQKVSENRFPLEIALALIRDKHQALDEQMKALGATRRRLQDLESEIVSEYGESA